MDVVQGRKHLHRVDIKLRRIIDAVDCPKLPRMSNTLESLIRIIIGQQLSGKAAATIFGRVKDLNGRQSMTAEWLLHLSEREYRTAGVSRPKIKAIRNVSAAVIDDRINFRRFTRMGDDEIADAIMAIKGLGRWSAQMYLMFVLQRPDVFPSGDGGIKRAVAELYRLEPTEENLLRVSAKWRPFRSLASLYLWRSLENR